MCVKSILFSILINEEPKGFFFHPSKGLRQGDPFSPYLFLLCMEGLISMLTRAKTTKQISGVFICRGAPCITHLLFVDNNMLYFKANATENRVIMDILTRYELASGKKVNKDKTSMHFSRSMPVGTKQQIKDMWGMTSETEHATYLGLPQIVGKVERKPSQK